MTKESKSSLQKGIDVVKLIVLGSVAAAAITTALTFFAKSTTVQMLDHRLGLSISQDIVDGKKADVRWMRQQAAFENRKTPPTFGEKEMIQAAETELKEKKKLHGERVKHFEEKYKTQY